MNFIHAFSCTACQSTELNFLHDITTAFADFIPYKRVCYYFMTGGHDTIENVYMRS